MSSSLENQVLDLQRLRSLDRILGQALQAIVLRFFEDCSNSLESLRVEITANDALKVRKIAHQMKGASASIGFKQLETWFGFAEKAANENVFPSNEETAVASRLLDDAKQEFDRFWELCLSAE